MKPWITSADVVSTFTVVLTGTTIRLSVSSRRGLRALAASLSDSMIASKLNAP